MYGTLSATITRRKCEMRKENKTNGYRDGEISNRYAVLAKRT